MKIKPQTTNNKKPRRRTKVLAVSSSGGHWVQLLRLRPAFVDCNLVFATVNPDYASEVTENRFRLIRDGNRNQWFKLACSLWSILRLIVSENPDIVISTGAAPGFFAIRLGRFLGKKTIWIDSIANAEELSLSGQKAGKYVSLWITQWKHLSKPEGPRYFGDVLGADIDSESEEDSPAGVSKAGDKRRLFVTVGSDVPFDRMIKAVDEWAGRNKNASVFAQVGGSTFQPQNIEYCKFLEPKEFSKKLKDSTLVVAHAGMGTILSSLVAGKPILVMPRKGSLGETRNEHQSATVHYLGERNGIHVALDPERLVEKLNQLDRLVNGRKIGPWASAGLTEELKKHLS